MSDPIWTQHTTLQQAIVELDDRETFAIALWLLADLSPDRYHACAQAIVKIRQETEARREVTSSQD